MPLKMPQHSLMRATLALALFCSLLACRQSPQYEFDLIITGGKLIDGSGSLWFPGDLAIRGKEIVHVGRLKDLEQKGRRVIDARGLWVTPGFIDIHSRSDPDTLLHPDSLGKVRQGVTTEILVAGNSDHPRQAGAGRTPWEETFRRLQQGELTVNVASYVRTGDVGRLVLGEDRRDPTQPEVAAMKHRVGQAMLEGALGLFTSPPPAAEGFLSGEQIAELAREAKAHGGVYAAEIDVAAGIRNSVKEAIQLAEQAQIPLDILGLRVTDRRARGQLQEVFDSIEKARESGLALTASLSPYSNMSEEDLQKALKAPWVSIGSGGATAAGDPPGGEKPRPHGYGAFARVLGKYVREEGILDLEEAIHKMTGMNAAKSGLRNRGLLQVGMMADITIFDAERVAGPATFLEPRRFAEGIEYVIVNGTPVIESGRPLDARPGQILYGPGKPNS